MGGGWQVSDELYPIEVKNRTGDTGTVYIRELSENDVRTKNARMIQFNRQGGDAQSARIRLEAIRKFEMEQSIVDWTFENGDGEKIPVTPMTVAQLPQAVANQIHDKIIEFNELPEDETDEDGKVVEENPTSESSDETYLSG